MSRRNRCCSGFNSMNYPAMHAQAACCSSKETKQESIDLLNFQPNIENNDQKTKENIGDTSSESIKVEKGAVIRMNLSHKGVSRLDDTRDFSLIIGDRTVECSRSQIRFLSPKIAHILNSDPTFDKFKISVPECLCLIDVLENILAGLPIEVPRSKIDVFDRIISELGNDELLSVQYIEVNSSNVFDVIREKSQHFFDISKDVRFIASHFFELPRDHLMSLEISVLASVLESEELVLKSENDLFELIIDFGDSKNEDISCLLSCLHLEYLSSSHISQFVDLVTNDNFGILWPCMRSHLVVPINHSSVEESKRFSPKHDEISSEHVVTYQLPSNCLTAKPAFGLGRPM